MGVALLEYALHHLLGREWEPIVAGKRDRIELPQMLERRADSKRRRDPESLRQPVLKLRRAQFAPGWKMEPKTGFEPVTYGLRNRCSTN